MPRIAVEVHELHQGRISDGSNMDIVYLRKSLILLLEYQKWKAQDNSTLNGDCIIRERLVHAVAMTRKARAQEEKRLTFF